MTFEQDAIRHFGAIVAKRFEAGGGEPEDLLRGPFEELLSDLASHLHFKNVALAGEYRLAAERIRPDYGAHVNGALVGFIEVKAPGTGVQTALYRGRNKKQWERLSQLPNVLYADGQSFALYRSGELTGPIVELRGDVRSAGRALGCKAGVLSDLTAEFLSWVPIAPRRPKELAISTARLCRVLRAEVTESLEEGSVGLRDLAEDWRRLLYPEADDKAFADGYAQTVTFALLLARVEGIELDRGSLRDVADELGSKHTLMARALTVLTDPDVLPKLAVSVETLRRVLSVVDWEAVSRNNPKAWLYFYEEFLDEYDRGLRKKTGSYYTPAGAVQPMVRLTEELLKTRLGQTAGYASPEVTVVDPAVGTGTFLFQIVDEIAEAVEKDEGEGAVGPRLRSAARRLIGFEIQASPYSVAELRLATEFKKHGAELGPDDLRLYMTDTLSDPFIEESHLAATYRPIAESRKKANEVKRSKPVVVVIGNPPYKEKSKGKGGWIESGSPQQGDSAPLDDFKPDKSLGLGTHVKHLYNLYVYFWRWGLWKVFEGHPGDRGLVSFVSASGFLGGPGFSEMRSYMRRKSDAIWVIDLSPEGHQPDVSTRVFPGVQQPICITIALRDGSTDEDTPAPVYYTSVSGSAKQKYAQLATLELDGEDWVECPKDWHAPLLPEAQGRWTTFPSLDDLLTWSGSGTMPGRTWVVGPDPDVLRDRWSALIAADPDDQPDLLQEHKRDRRMDTRLSDNLPGYETKGSLGTEISPCEAPVRYGWRTLDRGWIIPDKRVINRPNPSLWQVRSAPGQIYLTALHTQVPSGGPSTSFAGLVPDLDHHKGSGAGRAYPLWLDDAGAVANVNPGLLDCLSNELGMSVSAEDLFAYIAAVTAQAAFIEECAGDLVKPGIRVPLTKSDELFSRGVELGERIIWLHTFGERYDNPEKGRPLSPPRAEDPRPKVTTAIPDTAEGMPEDSSFDPGANTLKIGAGEVSGVTPEMWAYETSGYKLVRRWLAKRMKKPGGRKQSGLDLIVATRWRSTWTSELIDLLNVVSLLCELELEQADWLRSVLAGDLVSVSDLNAASVLPVVERLKAQKPPRQATL